MASSVSYYSYSLSPYLNARVSDTVPLVMLANSPLALYVTSAEHSAP
uniref:Uncharacterized protein n=1 Tax=Myoviridae sp. ct0jJ30 TaxID=2825014 RepID=A0A8S5PJ80_9CAUD|nr:MAG TPA: hypothetical protein [Myoviridae sp. ct0jJ30]